MNYTAKIEGLENQRVEAVISFWSAPKLLINGVPAPKGQKRGETVLQREDGRQAIVTWKPQFLGLDVPQLVVDGKVINMVEPLQWYQWVWGGWPVVLLFVGGALGAIVGAAAAVVNTKIFRAEMSEILKYLLTGVISVAAVVFYFIAAFAISLLLNR